MFSLIISIISIALVAALAAATVYFGGAAFNKGTAGADASAFVNSGQQIAGSFTLAATDGYDISTADLADLATAGGLGTGSPVYLAQVPTYKGATLNLVGNYVAVQTSVGACKAIVSRVDGVKEEDVTFTASGLPTTGLYDCVQVNAAGATDAGGSVAANDYVAVYKVR